jgi:DNA-binding Xre family transcriptional regulator
MDEREQVIQNIRDNIERLMVDRGYNMKTLSLTAGLNETAVRDILKGRVSHPTYETLRKVAKVLDCSVNEIVGVVPAMGSLTHGFRESIFIHAVEQVDEIISKNKIDISSANKARVYWAWYELSVLKKRQSNSDELHTLLKFAGTKPSE